LSCDICGRSSCCSSFHSLAEQERYEKVIDAFEKARDLRNSMRDEIEEEEDDLCVEPITQRVIGFSAETLRECEEKEST
jgi:transcription elongation factor Elf1